MLDTEPLASEMEFLFTHGAQGTPCSDAWHTDLTCLTSCCRDDHHLRTSGDVLSKSASRRSFHHPDGRRLQECVLNAALQVYCSLVTSPSSFLSSMLAAMIELRVIVPPAYQGRRSLASAVFRASKHPTPVG